jgi:ribulose-phosphate 3-epimerase
MKKLIAPSLLSADFSCLKDEIEMINQSEADWFHIDVMDGVFVPNISFGFPVIEWIRKFAEKPLDVHLMIVNPDRYIKRFREVGANILSVHYEACPHLHRTIEAIKSEGMQAGVVLNPHTPVDLLKDIIADVDLVLDYVGQSGLWRAKVHSTFLPEDFGFEGIDRKNPVPCRY